MRRSGWTVGLACLVLAGFSASATARPRADARAKPPEPPPPIAKDAIIGATFTASPTADAKSKAGPAKKAQADPLMIKVQVLLDRARFSPGAIDGRDGENVQGALSAFAVAQGLPATKTLDQATFDKLVATGSEPAVTEYTITEDDVKGPFTKIPPKLEDQADLDRMVYTNTREMLAERFHMKRDLLSALNPDKPLDKAGTVILVAAVTPTGDGKVKDRPIDPKVERIEVDKTARRVIATGKDGALIGSYPASIGSKEKPAPDGSFKVTGVAFDPWYRYDPKYRFKGVKTRRPFKIAPGPNSPVGLVWIDLSIPSYGIHGTPEPENIGKTESHGCIRLTNWDVRELAKHVPKGAKVDFVEK